MIIRNKYSYFFWISLQIMATVHCTISMDKRTENLNKHEILSLLVIKCVTLLDYERCLVRYLCHLTFVLRTITYRSSLKLNLDSLKRNCAHSGIRYLVYDLQYLRLSLLIFFKSQTTVSSYVLH